MRFGFFTILFFLSPYVHAQVQENEPDSLKEYSSQPVPVYTKGYLNKYNNAKKLVLKTYPYALYAADVIDQIDQKSESMKRRRKKHKFFKNSYKQLKEDFKYVILDLYTAEGVMLMKLTHREIGLTVFEISEKYKGKRAATMFSLMGKLWGQDVKIQYEPAGRDKIIEQVITDIENGLINFSEEVSITSKEDFKVEKKKDKAWKKSNKKALRIKKRVEKKKARHKKP